jgi:hypothetical protein
VLVKSRTSNEELLAVMKEAMRHAPAAPASVIAPASS